MSGAIDSSCVLNLYNMFWLSKPSQSQLRSWYHNCVLWTEHEQQLETTSPKTLWMILNGAVSNKHVHFISLHQPSWSYEQTLQPMLKYWPTKSANHHSQLDLIIIIIIIIIIIVIVIVIVIVIDIISSSSSSIIIIIIIPTSTDYLHTHTHQRGITAINHSSLGKI